MALIPRASPSFLQRRFQFDCAARQFRTTVMVLLGVYASQPDARSFDQFVQGK
jgi:hypothetical protein